MVFAVNKNGIQAKYGSWTSKIMVSIEDLGPTLDISTLSEMEIRKKFASLDKGEPVCLVGGYDIIPPLRRPNPTSGSQDNDRDIPTDAPYAVPPDAGKEEEYAPRRAISRIPDGGTKDPPSFLKILAFQKKVPKAVTPPGSYEEGAREFHGALAFVHEVIPKPGDTLYDSPPQTIDEPELPQGITQKGRIHILLHGADRSPDWAYLFGRDASAPAGEYPKALSARVLDLCDMRGAW